MAQNDIYLVRESSDGTFEEIANSPFRYDATNATDAPDKANNTFHINTKLRVDELEVNGDTTVIHTDSNTTEQLSVTNDGTGPAAIINQIGAEPLIDIQDDGVSALYIEDGGNVGIGTTNPTAPLHVVGNSAFTDPDGIGSYLIIGHPSIGGGAQSAQIRMYDSNDVLNMNLIGGGEYVFYNGNVGIGPLGASSAAGDMLHISTAELNCGLTLHAETKQAKLIANNEGTLSLIAGNGGNSPAAKMVFELNGSEVMRIDPAGILNIGNGSDPVWVKLTSALGTFSLGSSTYDMVDGVDTKKYFSIYDDDAAKHRVWINEIGDVGIGTTNPDYKLDVHGWISAQAEALSTDAVINLAASNASNYSAVSRIKSTSESDTNGSSSLTFTTRGSDNSINEAMRINSDGNVGIGTASPGEALEVVGVVHATVPEDSNAYTRLTYGGGLTKVNGTGDNRVTQPALIMHRVGEDGSSERTVSIHSDKESYLLGGDVGIGTASPAMRLDVREDKDTTYGTVNHGPAWTAFFRNHEAEVADRFAGIGFQSASPAGGYATGWIGVVSKDKVGDMVFGIRDEDGSAKEYHEAMRITSGGNVGIGTTSPNALLEVAGATNPEIRITDTDPNSAASGTFRAEDGGVTLGTYTNHPLYLVNDNTTSMTILSGGNVGIGSTSPSCSLHIKGADPSDGGETKICLESNDGTQNAAIAHVDEEGNERLSIRVGGHSATVDKMTILNSGNVGIGTAEPDLSTHGVHVKGGAHSTVQIEGATGDSFIGLGTPSDLTASYQILHKRSTNSLLIGTPNSISNNSPIITLKGANVGIGTTNPTANLEVSNTGGATSNMIWAKGDALPGDAGMEGAWTTYGVKTYDEAAGQPDYSYSVGMDSSETGVPKFKIGYSFHDANKPGDNSLFTIESNGDIHFTGDLYQNGSLFSGSGAGGGGGGGSTQNPDGSWSGGTSFGGGTPSTNYPNPLDVSSDTSAGTSFTISSTYDDGTPQGTGNTYRFLSDTDGGLKIGPDGGDGTSFTNNAMLLLLPEPMGGDISGSQARSKLSVQNSYLEVLGHTDLPAGSSYNQDDTELKLLTSIGHKSTYCGAVDFDYKDLNFDDTLPIYYFHLVFRNSTAGSMNGFKYKAEIGSSRFSTANNSTHWVNTGFATDESFAYFENDLDFYSNNQHMGTVESVGKIEIVSREVYPTRDDSGDLWGMKALPGDSDLTIDDQTNYIVRYGIRFSDNFLHSVTTPNAEKEGRLHIQLEFMQAGAYGSGVIAPHFINVPPSTAAPNVTGLAYDESPSTPNRMHFGWNDVPGAGRTYRIEVATDSGFTNLVHSVASYGAAQESVSGLTPNTLYYVRVKANPIAGEDVESLNWATMSATTKT